VVCANRALLQQLMQGNSQDDGSQQLLEAEESEVEDVEGGAEILSLSSRLVLGTQAAAPRRNVPTITSPAAVQRPGTASSSRPGTASGGRANNVPTIVARVQAEVPIQTSLATSLGAPLRGVPQGPDQIATGPPVPVVIGQSGPRPGSRGSSGVPPAQVVTSPIAQKAPARSSLASGGGGYANLHLRAKVEAAPAVALAAGGTKAVASGPPQIRTGAPSAKPAMRPRCGPEVFDLLRKKEVSNPVPGAPPPGSSDEPDIDEQGGGFVMPEDSEASGLEAPAARLQEVLPEAKQPAAVPRISAAPRRDDVGRSESPPTPAVSSSAPAVSEPPAIDPARGAPVEETAAEFVARMRRQHGWAAGGKSVATSDDAPTPSRGDESQSKPPPARRYASRDSLDSAEEVQPPRKVAEVRRSNSSRESDTPQGLQQSATPSKMLTPMTDVKRPAGGARARSSDARAGGSRGPGTESPSALTRALSSDARGRAPLRRTPADESDDSDDEVPRFGQGGIPWKANLPRQAVRPDAGAPTGSPPPASQAPPRLPKAAPAPSLERRKLDTSAVGGDASSEKGNGQQPVEQLFYSKKPREVDYTPATVEEYRQKYVSKEYGQLGSLGPDLDDEKLLMKKAMQEKVKQFSKELHRVNKARGAHAPPAPKPEPSKPDPRANARAKALEFARNVPKPKVDAKSAPEKRPKEPQSPSLQEKEWAEAAELERKERQHFDDVAKVRAIKDFLEQLGV